MAAPHSQQYYKDPSDHGSCAPTDWQAGSWQFHIPSSMTKTPCTWSPHPRATPCIPTCRVTRSLPKLGFIYRLLYIVYWKWNCTCVKLIFNLFLFWMRGYVTLYTREAVRYFYIVFVHSITLASHNDTVLSVLAVIKVMINKIIFRTCNLHIVYIVWKLEFFFFLNRLLPILKAYSIVVWNFSFYYFE